MDSVGLTGAVYGYGIGSRHTPIPRGNDMIRIIPLAMHRVLISKLCTVVTLGAVSLLFCDAAMAITRDECKASGGAWGQLGATEGDGYCYRMLVKPAAAGVVSTTQLGPQPTVRPRPTAKKLQGGSAIECKAKHHRRSIYTGWGGPKRGCS